jgi:L-threonylcarbamoyladenylate synthase
MRAAPFLPTDGYLFFDGASRDVWAARTGALHAQSAVLSETGDLTEAAAKLFDTLHELDHAGMSAIHAQRVPDTGLGRAINDRLNRAASKG